MLRVVSLNGEPIPEPPPLIFTTVIDQAEDDVRHPHREAFLRNSWWLTEHYFEVLPSTQGKYLAVAGLEAFVADSAEEARSLARTAHPQDTGMILRYVHARSEKRNNGIPG